MDIQKKFFFDSLMRYIENPCEATRLDFSRQRMVMDFNSRNEEEEFENRIVERVLERLSVRLDNDGSLKEIKSLQRELDKLYGMFA